MTLRTEIFAAPSKFITKYATSLYVPSDFLGFLLFYVILQMVVRTTIPLPSNVKTMKNPLKEKGLFYGEIVSIVHATLANLMVIWCWSEIGVGFNKTNRIPQLLVLYNTLSYFLVDSIASQIFSYADTISRIHHLICIIGQLVPFYYGYGAAECVANTLMAEISNPFLQSRNTLRRAGIMGGCLYHFLEKIFVVTFLLCRLFLCIPLIWIQAASQNCPLILVLLTSGICTLSMIWNIEIINKLWKKIRELKTENGTKPLTPRLEKINNFMKKLVHDKLTRMCVGTYCVVIYYAAPLSIYRLKIFG